MLTASDVKYYASLKQKKHSREQKKFLIEGFHLVEECLSSDYNLEMIILRSGTDLKKYPKILSALSKNKTKVESLPETAFNKLADTENPQGIVGVVTRPENTTGKDLGNLVLALDRISDPGNLGTILRTAYWFGVQSVFISTGSADVYNSKLIRSSQGAIFHVNVYENVNLEQKLSEFDSNSYKIYLFTPSAEKELSEVAKSGMNEKSVLVFGSESQGISEELLGQNFIQIKIGGYSGAESLNVALSCAIALYEFRKTNSFNK